MLTEKKNLAICTILLFIFFNSLTLADPNNTDSLKTYNLDEVVVIASKSEKKILDIGRSVSVITNDYLKSSLFTSPSDLLARFEGISIIGTEQNPGTLQSIHMRGANTNQTVIMVDGIRITDPSSVDNAVDLSELSFANVSRVEMIRGSHSTLYGSSAIGGVVNFITDKYRKTGFNTDVLLSGGTFGNESSELSQNVLLNYTTPGGFYFSGEVLNTKVNGIDATIDTVTTPGFFKNIDKDNFEKLDLVGKVGFINSTWDIFASLKSTTQKLDIDDGAFRDDDNNTQEFDRLLFSTSADFRLNNNIRFNFTTGYTEMERTAIDDSSIVDILGTYDHTYSRNTFNGSVFTSELRTELKYENFNAVLGGSFYNETMNNKSYLYSKSFWGIYENSTDLDSLDIKTSTTSLFAYMDINGKIIQDNLEWFNLGLGGRITNNSKFGSEFTFELNPSIKVSKNTLLYLSYATGYSAPPLYRLFSPFANYLSGITRGNENLKPEESQSFEAGLKYKLGDGIVLTASAFITSVDNNIEYVYLWDKDVSIDQLGTDWMRDDNRGDTYLNLGTLQTKGIEAGFEAKVLDELLLTFNVSIIDGKMKYSPSDIDETQTQGNHVQLYSNGVFLNTDSESEGLARRSNTANIALSYSPIETLNLGLDIRYVGKKDDVYYDLTKGPWGALGTLAVSDYTLFDLSAKYEVMEGITVMLKVRNLFDRNYYEILGYSTRGRGVYFGLRYSM